MSFLVEVVSHFRLTWRLFWDERVHWWQRIVFGIPLIYLLIPFRYDIVVDLMPLIGLLDDWLLFLFCTYVFVAICPRVAKREHRAAVLLSDPDSEVRERACADLAALETLSATERLEMYRHPYESLALALGLAILVGVSALGGVLVGVLLLLSLGFSHIVARILQAQVMGSAVRVDEESFPQVQECIDRCFARLPQVPVNIFVLPSASLNAYSFGVDRPYTVVLCSRLVDELDADELVAVIGHELGHIFFEHTFLSSLMGGMLYRTWTGLLWALVFARWRRFAELTADRIALLACGELDTTVRLLIRLSSGVTDKVIDVQAAIRQACDTEAYGPARVRGQSLLVTRIRAAVDFDAELFALDVEKWLTADE